MRTIAFSSINKAAASAKPNRGESSNASPTSLALDQSTPDVPLRPCNSAFVTPTPIIEPMSVCELDAGPGAEVPNDRRNQQSKHHREAGMTADLQDQLYWQQRNDSKGDSA